MGFLFFVMFLFVVGALVLSVLLQEGKGGGLTGNAAGMDSVMGARNPLRRITVILFIVFVVLVVGMNKWYASRDGDIPLGEDLTEEAPTVPAPPVTEGMTVIAPPTTPEERPAEPEDALDNPEAPAPAAPEAPAVPAAPEPEAAEAAPEAPGAP